MKRILFVVFCVLLITVSYAQNISQQLTKAFTQFENDPQLRAAIASLYVVDNKTGKVVFEKNAGVGLAPASTQKLITSAAAYDLLGKNFRYKTEFAIATGNSASLYVLPSGDPTLGSWRWERTKDRATITRIATALRKNLTSLNKIVFVNRGWNFENIPDGWIWQDIGNYYGAGADVLNWRENQFDLILKSGKAVGDKVAVVKTNPELYSYKLSSAATAAAKGSGDNAYIYFPLNGEGGIVRGTIPVNENAFEISGALPAPGKEFAALLENELKDLKTNAGSVAVTSEDELVSGLKTVHTELSPTLDSIVYWLNRKSINLYAEALVKTIGYQKEKAASTEKGVTLIKDFWKEKGIDPIELNIVDGSGLSPLNRVTTKAQVRVLLYAKKQNWFNGFYLSLPEYNGMKMKSGTINNVKAFAGYQTSSSGDYVFSFIVNNYNGSSATLVQKMYTVLNVLK